MAIHPMINWSKMVSEAVRTNEKTPSLDKLYIRKETTTKTEFKSEKKLMKIEAILERFKGEIPQDQPSRREIANSLLLLKQRVKDHTFSGVFGNLRWILSLFFSSLRFEKSKLGKEFSQIETSLGQSNKIMNHNKELIDYIFRRKIPLPNGLKSSYLEGAEAVRAYWLTLKWDQIGQAEKDVPKPLRGEFQSTVDQAIEANKKEFRLYYTDKHLTSYFDKDQIPEMIRKKWLEIVARPMCHLELARGSFKMGIDHTEDYMDYVIGCMKEVNGRLPNLILKTRGLCAHLNPRLIPFLAKCDALTLEVSPCGSNGLTYAFNEFAEVITQVLRLHLLEKKAPPTISYTLVPGKDPIEPCSNQMWILRFIPNRLTLNWKANHLMGTIDFVTEPDYEQYKETPKKPYTESSSSVMPPYSHRQFVERYIENICYSMQTKINPQVQIERPTL